MFTSVLVPLDGSELAEGILPYVAQIASGVGARITLITVVDPDMLEIPAALRGESSGGRVPAGRARAGPHAPSRGERPVRAADPGKRGAARRGEPARGRREAARAGSVCGGQDRARHARRADSEVRRGRGMRPHRHVHARQKPDCPGSAGQRDGQGDPLRERSRARHNAGARPQVPPRARRADDRPAGAPGRLRAGRGRASLRRKPRPWPCGSGLRW